MLTCSGKNRHLRWESNVTANERIYMGYVSKHTRHEQLKQAKLTGGLMVHTSLC